MTQEQYDRARRLCKCTTRWSAELAGCHSSYTVVEDTTGDEVAAYLSVDDAEFVVGARTLLPLAMDEIRRLRARVARLTAKADRI